MVRVKSCSRFAGVLLALFISCCMGTLAQSTQRAIGMDSLPGDLSVGVVEQILKDHPTPASLGKWGYTQGLTLYAMEQVFRRTHDARYLRYIQNWADTHVDASGKIDAPIDTLDDMLPGLLMLSLYQDTGEPRYRNAAQTIRKRLDTYPRTADGGLWHGATNEHQHQLWLDGMFMSMPFLVQYDATFGDRKNASREAAHQLLIYARHLSDPKTGLLFHAYDETGTQAWAQPESHHSSFFWARSIGWYGVAVIDVLEVMPKNDPDRAKLITLLRQIVSAIARFQDQQSGLWYNVVDKGSEPGNWLETSASAMYIYIVSTAVEHGYVPAANAKVACKGYRGISAELSASPDGLVSVANICAGTVVGDLAFYFQRPRNTNDIHGLGPFLLMNEQMRKSGCTRQNASPVRSH